jgi:hypothetical protein
MQPDFIERLKADADGLEGEIGRQTESVGARVNTNASIEETLDRVDELVERIGVIVRNKYREDAARLAAWESARHLERAARTKRSGTTPQTPQTNQ